MDGAAVKRLEHTSKNPQRNLRSLAAVLLANHSLDRGYDQYANFYRGGCADDADMVMLPGGRHAEILPEFRVKFSEVRSKTHQRNRQ